MIQAFLTKMRSSRVLTGLTLSNWMVILVLGALLLGAIAIASVGWTSAAGTVVPTSGFVALTLGVVLSLVVGIGLMGLLFYSSRNDYDEAPKFVLDENDQEEPSEVHTHSDDR
jgi:hypothetical protein